MWPNDLLALLANLIYLALGLWLAEEVRRHRPGWKQAASALPRLLLALFVLPSLTFFATRWAALLVPAGLLAALVLLFRGRKAPGPAQAAAWFLAAYVLLIGLFWQPNLRYAAAVGLLAGAALMAGGEVGEALWGSTRHQLFGRRAAAPGELLAFAFGWVALVAVLGYLAVFPLGQSLSLAFLLALAGLLVRLATPGEAAHFTVPVSLALATVLLYLTGEVNPLLGRLLWSAALAGAVALAGLRWRALSPDGAAAACGVGTFVFTFGGWVWAATLVAFFATSTALTHWKSAHKEKVRGVEGHEGPRRAGQVLANGGVAAAVAALSLFFPGREGLFGLIFAGAVAEAAADTWATELGVLSPVRPRLITGGGECPPGTSGGVTLVGLLASAAGALCIALVSLVGGVGTPFWPWAALQILIPWASGFAGALLDSLAGATIQATYRCPDCGAPTEEPVHSCGARATLTRGWPAVDNNAVNLLGTASGAVIALALGLAAGF